MSGNKLPSTKLGYRAALNRLASAQKPGASNPAYLRWVNRPLGRRAAAAAYVLGLSPNAVTALSALLSATALVLIAFAPTTLGIAVSASALLLAGYALDSADGQLARLTSTGSLAGEWLDHVVDAARLPLFHLAIAVHFFRTDESLWLVGAACLYVVITSVWFFAQTLAEKLTPPATAAKPGASEPEPAPAGAAPAWVSWAKTPYDVGTLYLAVLALSFTAVFAAIYVALFVVTLAVALLSMRRKYRALAAASAPEVRTPPTPVPVPPHLVS